MVKLFPEILYLVASRLSFRRVDLRLTAENPSSMGRWSIKPLTITLSPNLGTFGACESPIDHANQDQILEAF